MFLVTHHRRALVVFGLTGLTLMSGLVPASAQTSGALAVPPATPTLPAPAEAAPIVPDDYRLDTGDAIQIEVLRHPAQGRLVRLYADALVRLPRLNSPVSARGRTCAEIAEELTRRLETEGKLRLVKNAVSVTVADTRPRRIYVRGNAGKSGDLDLRNGWRVSEVIAVMGGVVNPERATVQIVNTDKTKRPAPVSLNLANALANSESADNVYLQEGDTITINVPGSKRFVVKGEGPRGTHEIDERLGLRQALIRLGFTTNGATGDLRRSRLLRHETPSDPNSPQTPMPVDLVTLLTKEETPDVPLQDNDTLEIPVSQDFINFWGETSAPRKILLTQDRPMFLSDVLGMGGTSARAKIDNIQIYRKEWVDKNGKPVAHTFKFGKFLSKHDQSQNPELKAGDWVYVPAVNRPDVIGGIWQSWGLFGIVQSLFPGARLR